MTNLDISIVMFGLAVVLILDILAIGLRTKYLAFLGMIFGIVAIAYFIQNYSSVSIGTLTTTIPFQLFIVAWIVLPILGSFIVGLET